MRISLLCMLLAASFLAAACSPFPQGIDPFHPPKEGGPAPATVVEIELPNRYEFDLIPTRVNGVEMQFNEDPWDNEQEPLLIPPGLVRFVFTNTGTISHNLRVQDAEYKAEGGIDVMAPPAPAHLMEGQMAEMEVDLPEGEYMMTCAVTNHYTRGMLRSLIVTAEAAYPPPPLNSPKH